MPWTNAKSLSESGSAMGYGGIVLRIDHSHHATLAMHSLRAIEPERRSGIIDSENIGSVC